MRPAKLLAVHAVVVRCLAQRRGSDRQAARYPKAMTLHEEAQTFTNPCESVRPPPCTGVVASVRDVVPIFALGSSPGSVGHCTKGQPATVLFASQRHDRRIG